MDPKLKPRLAKAHSLRVADEYLRLGWSLVTEFRAAGDDEPYEYLFRWDRLEEPRPIDRAQFPPPEKTD